MRKFHLIIVASLIAISSCKPDVSNNIVYKDSDSIEQSNEEEKPKDIFAIGEIKFGISESQFNEARDSFLNNKETLDGLRIDKFKGFFHKGKLSAIQIVSINRKNVEGSWEYLYYDKYKEFCVHNKANEYDIEGKKIRVTDDNLSNKTADSIKSLMSYEFQHQSILLLPHKQSFHNEEQAIMYTRDVLYILPNKDIANKFESELFLAQLQPRLVGYKNKYTIALSFYRKYYSMALSYTKDYNKKHEKSSIYSMIIIISNDYIQEYNEKLRKDFNDRNKKTRSKDSIREEEKKLL